MEDLEVFVSIRILKLRYKYLGTYLSDRIKISQESRLEERAISANEKKKKKKMQENREFILQDRERSFLN